MADRVEVFCQGRVVTRHDRCWEAATHPAVPRSKM
ncbi:hypothetical protein ACVCAH_33350 [Micromonospora sp. LZ34]